MSGPRENLAVLRGRVGFAVSRRDAEAEQAARQILNEANLAIAIKDGLKAKGGLSDDARFRLAQLLIVGEN